MSAGQGVGAAAERLQKNPAGQAAQLALEGAPVAFDHVPAGQGKHVLLPTLGLYVPTGQLAQDEAPAALSVPAAQLAQEGAPTPLNAPAAQGMHVAEDKAPRALEYVPAGHALCVPLVEPAGQ